MVILFIDFICLITLFILLGGYLLYNIVVFFLPYINMNWPQVYKCALHPKPPSHPFPHTIPPGFHRAQVLGALLHIASSHWLSILHTVIHMFQFYFLKSSHCFLLPLSTKVCSLCLCLLMSALYIGSSVPSFQIPYICGNIQYSSF